MTAALALANALRESRRPMLVASWEVGATEPGTERSQWVYPAKLLHQVLGYQESYAAGCAALLPALLGKDEAFELLSDMVSDLQGGRACFRWSREAESSGTAEEICEALEIRSVKAPASKSGLQRHYFLLSAVLREELKDVCSKMEALSIRNSIDKALAALTELAASGFHGLRPQACQRPQRRLPGSPLRYHAELFDSEVFCSRPMSMARIASALVTLTLPKGGVPLDEGVYCGSISEDFGAVVAIKSGATQHVAQVAAEISCFQRPSGDSRIPQMVPLEAPIGTSGSLHDLCWLRPFYHKLASRSGPAGLQQQVQLDVLAARDCLWPTSSSDKSKRRPAAALQSASPAETSLAAALPPYLVMSEVLPYMDLLELPSWAFTSASFYEAAAEHAMRALRKEAVQLPGGLQR